MVTEQGKYRVDWEQGWYLQGTERFQWQKNYFRKRQEFERLQLVFPLGEILIPSPKYAARDFSPLGMLRFTETKTLVALPLQPLPAIGPNSRTSELQKTLSTSSNSYLPILGFIFTFFHSFSLYYLKITSLVLTIM